MTSVETYLRYQDVFVTPSTFEQFEAERIGLLLLIDVCIAHERCCC
jgi:hypothetical protein